jgi:hypothetical protein
MKMIFVFEWFFGLLDSENIYLLEEKEEFSMLPIWELIQTIISMILKSELLYYSYW